MEFTKLKSSQGIPSSTYDLRRELWLLTYASNSCKLVDELCDFVLSGACEEGDSVYTGIINAIYVAYGRSFHRCWNIGKLTESDLPVESVAFHKEIMQLRDKLYAHKDLNACQVESESFNTVKAVVLNGRIRMISNELIPRKPIVFSIKDHVTKMVRHFDTKATALLDKVREPDSIADGEYVLNMDAFSDEIFLSVQESEATTLVKKLAEQPCVGDGEDHAAPNT